ncbi:MAG: hypothetical protein HYU64_12230, partial [Armatimonadetes bacterium]|nr:hypothetical protein [Armatimonadota bacterium]
MKGTPWLLFLLAVAYASGLWLSLHYFHYINFILFWVAGTILATIPYKTMSIPMEMATLFLPWLVSRYLFPMGEGITYFPLV